MRIVRKGRNIVKPSALQCFLERGVCIVPPGDTGSQMVSVHGGKSVCNMNCLKMKVCAEASGQNLIGFVVFVNA